MPVLNDRANSKAARTRLTKRARKLAEALAAQSNLPRSEVERMAAAQDDFERRELQAIARSKKGFDPARILTPKSGTIGARIGIDKGRRG